ncbi:Hypothetical protein A7982_00825 [Minicystis rosea]|nr:Hypothetical protein A7982_00825 [Minicystis rosea]
MHRARRLCGAASRSIAIRDLLSGHESEMHGDCGASLRGDVEGRRRRAMRGREGA